MPGDRLTPAEGEGTLCAALFETDDKTGLAKSVRPIRVGSRLPPASWCCQALNRLKCTRVGVLGFPLGRGTPGRRGRALRPRAEFQQLVVHTRPLYLLGVYRRRSLTAWGKTGSLLMLHGFSPTRRLSSG